ncbi:MAG TPA: RNA polymerase sigma factor [Pirellulales bacterium]|nr:RNA polymerase sigma factor [Pirellulales bacterium]
MSSATTAKPASNPAPDGWTEMSDEQLLLAYRSDGADGAFEALVRRYERELYSYLFRYLGDAEMAEDAFQAAFLQVHLKRDQFEEGRSFRPWLYTIATNQSIDAQRRNRRHRILSLDRRSESEEGSPSGSLADLLVGCEPEAGLNLERDERRQWVRQAVLDLPEQLRGAVILVYYQGFKYREAADVLAIPVGTVKSRLNAALHKLSDSWQASHADES